MRYSVRSWLAGAGAAGAVLAMVAFGQAGTASAAPAAAVVWRAGTPSAAYVPPDHDLRYGDHGPAVRSVQRRLNQLRYYAGPVDGKYGPDLEEAVWAFKEVQGLPMRASTNSLITAAFRHDLISPRQPKALVPKGGPDRIEVNLSEQVLVLYQHGKPGLIVHVSSGGGYYYPCPGDASESCGPAVTPDGNYKALAFMPGWVQVPLGEMYNPVFFIGRAYAIHGDIPVPWYPASHGCIRVWMDVATWLHKDVRIGTTHIYVRGKAPYQLQYFG